MKGYRKNVKTKTKKERKRLVDFKGKIGKEGGRTGKEGEALQSTTES